MYKTPQVTTQQIAIVPSDRGELAVMPVAKYRELANDLTNARTNKTGWLILSGCIGASCIIAAIGYVASLRQQPTIAPLPTPSPVIVEKPVIVDRNCLFWCSK